MPIRIIENYHDEIIFTHNGIGYDHNLQIDHYYIDESNYYIELTTVDE